MGAALPYDDTLHQRTANRARLACALVNTKIILKFTATVEVKDEPKREMVFSQKFYK